MNHPLRLSRRTLLTANRGLLYLLSWALIVAVALLSFFVHLLNEQVLRGQSVREEFRLESRPLPPALRMVQASPVSWVPARVDRAASNAADGKSR